MYIDTKVSHHHRNPYSNDKKIIHFLNRFTNFPWMLFDFGDYERHLNI